MTAAYWAVASPLEPTYTPPAAGEQQCQIHGDRLPCRGCRADRLAAPTFVPPPDLDRIEGESLVKYAHRIADMRNTNTEQEQL